VPVNQQMEILRPLECRRQWLPEADRLRLSDSEQRWLEKHPRVKVAAVDKPVPLSFSNEQGNEGLSAEVLSRISLRTGLRFDVEQGSSLPRQIDEVSSGVYARVSDSEHRAFREDPLYPAFTCHVPMCWWCRRQRPADHPGRHARKRLALINGNNLIMEIIRDFPASGLSMSKTPSALDLVPRAVSMRPKPADQRALHDRAPLPWAPAHQAPSAGNLRALPLASTAASWSCIRSSTQRC
jgi:two-component system sensor histidine kinase EvgS